MRRLVLFYLLVIITGFGGCMGDAYYKKLKAGYYLSAIDVKEDMVLGYLDGDVGIGVIDATVFAVGQNNNFIILKQHPRSFSNELDTTVTNYYIIPINDRISNSPEKNYYGPFTLEEFQQKKAELNIKDIDFNIVFKDLE